MYFYSLLLLFLLLLLRVFFHFRKIPHLFVADMKGKGVSSRRVFTLIRNRSCYRERIFCGKSFSRENSSKVKTVKKGYDKRTTVANLNRLLYLGKPRIRVDGPGDMPSSYYSRGNIETNETKS